MSTPVNGQSPPSTCLVVDHYSYYQCSSPLTFMEHLLYSRHFLKSFRQVVLFNPLNSPVHRTIISPILQVREVKPERPSDLLEVIHPGSGRAKPVRPSRPLCPLPQRVSAQQRLVSRAAIPEVKRRRGQLRNWCSFCRKQMFGVTYRTRCFISTTACLYLIPTLFPLRI